jgi:hypothetical protein
MARRRKLRIRIHRKGFTARRRGRKYRVRPTTYTRKAKGICGYCGAPVFARGRRIRGRWYHKQCAYVVFHRVPRR